MKNTLPFKSLWLFFFFFLNLCFEKSLLLTKAAFIWSIYSKNSNIVKMYSNLTFFKSEYTLKCSLFLWRSAEFSASLLQASVSHDLQKSFYNTDLLLKKHFWGLLVLKTVVLLHILNMIKCILRLINTKFKKNCIFNFCFFNYVKVCIVALSM